MNNKRNRISKASMKGAPCAICLQPMEEPKTTLIKGETQWVCLSDWAKIPSTLQPEASSAAELVAVPLPLQSEASASDDSDDSSAESMVSLDFLRDTEIIDFSHEEAPGAVENNKSQYLYIYTVESAYDVMALSLNLKSYPLPSIGRGLSPMGNLDDDVIAILLNTVMVRIIMQRLKSFGLLITYY